MINFITTSTVVILGDFLVLDMVIRSNTLQITGMVDTDLLFLLYEKMIKTRGKSGHQEIPLISLLQIRSRFFTAVKYGFFWPKNNSVFSVCKINRSWQLCN